jgi:hypothetical protein
MLGKIVGAVIGERATRHVGGISGPGGALLGVGTAALAKRLGPLGLIAVAVGGYAFKRHQDRKLANREAPAPESQAAAEK